MKRRRRHSYRRHQVRSIRPHTARSLLTGSRNRNANSNRRPRKATRERCRQGSSTQRRMTLLSLLALPLHPDGLCHWTRSVTRGSLQRRRWRTVRRRLPRTHHNRHADMRHVLMTSIMRSRRRYKRWHGSSGHRGALKICNIIRIGTENQHIIKRRGRHLRTIRSTT